MMYLPALILLYFLDLVNNQEFVCHTKETCKDCVQEVGCVWCIKPIPSHPNGTSVHCMSEDNYLNTLWCSADNIVSPQSAKYVIQDNPLQSQDDGNAVQVRPQKIRLKLRKGEEYELPFQYAQAKNYPVDLYYLMDLSASMEPHREKLAKLGGKLAQTMQKITSNFKLGFGSFVDKTEMPFTSTVPEKLESPCILRKNSGNVKCAPPYSFKNHMSLTENYNEFSSQVSSARVSGNLDAPEGGFDALMQAMVCKQEIGWRTQARHLLVFSTDVDFHIAGDGKLAGVVEPNDAKCHMENGTYTHALVYDYPSVSQINYVAKLNNINLIFAIVKTNKRNVIKIYKNLEESIENSNSGVLEQNSENVVKLVEDNYNKIVNTVVMTDNSGDSVEIKYTSDCQNSIENGCTNIHAAEVVNFKAKIRALECLPKDSPPKIITIKPEAVEETLTIELEVICNCDCEKSSHPSFVSDAVECTGAGNLQCGICSCHSGRFGRHCECDSQTSHSDDVSNCKANVNDTEVCSGMGTCRCGQCECHSRSDMHQIYGKYCQCNNFSCKRVAGELCSSRGTCDCGDCKCNAGWTGDACECPDTNSTCIAPGSKDLVCSGRGNCVCGECQCIVDDYHYSGKYCEECPSCPGQRCSELAPCVECQAYKTGIYEGDECSVKCTAFTVEVVDKIKDNQDEEVKICRVPDDSGCTIIFDYFYGENNDLVVRAQKEKICSEGVNVYAWVSGVIGSILLAGLLMLIVWKIVTTIHDHREYARFENERGNSKWNTDENPLFRPSTSAYKNPIYGRKSVRISKQFKT